MSSYRSCTSRNTNETCCLLLLLQITMKLRSDQDYAVEQLLDHGILVALVLLSDLGTLYICLLVDSLLCCLCGACVLVLASTLVAALERLHNLPMPRMP